MGRGGRVGGGRKNKDMVPFQEILIFDNMKFKTKIYKMGRSKRMGLMLPKGVLVENGEYEVEIPALPEMEEAVNPPEEPEATVPVV